MNNTPKKYFTLSTILGRVKEIIDENIKGRLFWLKVEIANINFHSSGHCYLELAETKDGDNIASCSSVIWGSDLANIRTDLGNDFYNILKKGNEILCYCEIDFSVKYGLKIEIKNVDLQFNLGALEKKKQETINKLKKEQLLDKNKQIKLPTIIQTIAIVGSPKTSGIEDIQKQLKNNTHGYYFNVQIYSTPVQGEKAEHEILHRLKELKNSDFDVIALVRGGGSKLDLEVFNSYLIAKEIALHDKPIFTGIGHETDLSVVDVVANVHHKTPTALGSYIVEKAREFEVKIKTNYDEIIDIKERFFETLKSRLRLATQDLTSTSISYTQLRRGKLHTTLNRINTDAREKMAEEKNKISLDYESINSLSKKLLSDNKGYLLHNLELIRIESGNMVKYGLDQFKYKMEQIFTHSKNIIKHNSNLIDNTFELIYNYHPEEILKKGYAIPRIDGELLKEQELKEGQNLEIELYNKILNVVFKNYKKSWKNNLHMKKQQKN